ncbi:hypothetical protein TcWFU_009314 [Taenia crassiceps]|uniref:Uncharacterized protein n=1 Tax=Taenia crassiceps TaxID=6207 RepID=A0ABR4QM81_9CEST
MNLFRNFNCSTFDGRQLGMMSKCSVSNGEAEVSNAGVWCPALPFVFAPCARSIIDLDTNHKSETIPTTKTRTGDRNMKGGGNQCMAMVAREWNVVEAMFYCGFRVGSCHGWRMEEVVAVILVHNPFN